MAPVQAPNCGNSILAVICCAMSRRSLVKFPLLGESDLKDAGLRLTFHVNTILNSTGHNLAGIPLLTYVPPL